jgi:hypothetical protein
MGPLSGDDGGYRRFEADRTDPNPSLEVAGTGLEHHARLMTIGLHQFESGHVCVVQIQEDVPRVPAASIWLNVYVTALTIANAQESYRRPLAQLGGRPEPFAWERCSGGVVNQSNQILVMNRVGIKACRDQRPGIANSREPGVNTGNIGRGDGRQTGLVEVPHFDVDEIERPVRQDCRRIAIASEAAPYWTARWLH